MTHSDEKNEPGKTFTSVFLLCISEVIMSITLLTIRIKLFNKQPLFSIRLANFLNKA